MILIDTNIWIDFFKGRRVVSGLSDLLMQNQVVIHPWIIGELLLGDLGSKRQAILSDLDLLKPLKVYAMSELRDFIEEERLFSKGLSLVDVQLLYAVLVEDCLLWTKDKALNKVVTSYKKNYSGL